MVPRDTLLVLTQARWWGTWFMQDRTVSGKELILSGVRLDLTTGLNLVGVPYPGGMSAKSGDQ